MQTELIQLKDGIVIEVNRPKGKTRPLAGGGKFWAQLSSKFSTIKPLLLDICAPVIATWRELNKDMIIDQAEIELGLAFEAEGNIYITKSKGSANLTIKLILKPPVIDAKES